MSLVHMGLIVYVHSISKDPLWSCRAWKLCPKSCLSKIVKYRTLILNHSCRMSDHVFRREHNIIMITANDISRRVLELYLFLTLSGVAPSAVSKGWDGADWAPPGF